MSEPLRLECEHFLSAVRTGEEPRTGVDEGVRVVEVLEAMQRSLGARRRDDLARGGRAVMWTADEAPGLVVAPDASIGAGVLFGANVTVHEGTVVGDGCTIGDNAVLGKQPVLSAASTTAGEVGRLVLGREVRVSAGAVLSAGASSATAASSATLPRCASA